MKILMLRIFRIRYSCLASGALALSCISAASVAEPTYPTTCAIAQYELLSAYHELSNSPKDKKLKQNVSTINRTLSECIQSISGRLSTDEANNLKVANSGMNSELDFNLSAIEKTGAGQGQSVSDMVNHALETTRILGTQKSGLNSSAISIRELAVQAAYLKNRYLERIYSLGGEANRETSAEPSIEKIVADFSENLDALRKDQSLIAKPEIKNKLSGVYVRFNFLRKTILDYNNTAVPFVVAHHSSLIIKSLLEVAEAAEISM